MTTGRDPLVEKFMELAGWEKRKRAEETALAACCAALGGAILLLPLHGFLPGPWLRWLMPALLFAACLPVFLHRRRWSRRDEVRAVAALDRSLHLEERALTAWDLTDRKEESAATQLVYEQAREQLRSVETRALFPRRRSWPLLLAPPLLGVWLLLLWFEVDRPGDRPAPKPQGLAQRAREYAQEFQEKAHSEGLRESLKMGQELEKLARQGIESNRGDEEFRKELEHLSQKFDEAARTRAETAGASGESRQALQDLRGELSAMRDLPELPELPAGAEEAGRQWAERLAGMPQLRRRLNEAQASGESSGRGDLKAFLDQLERRVTGELDRRALIDAQQYLKQMMKQGGQTQGENLAQSHQLPGGEDPPETGRREKTTSNLPGKEPGQSGDAPPSLPEFRPGSPTQLKGSLGQGESAALSFKAKPTQGKGAVTPSSEVVASYRRQAEQELNSERVPAALKETVKNYFLSLDDAAKRPGAE